MSNYSPRQLWIIAIVICVATISCGCGLNLPVGDTALGFQVENRLPVQIQVLSRYDDQNNFQQDFTLEPKASHVTEIMMIGTGVTIRATDSQGQVVFEKHYLWEDPNRPRGERVDIVIPP